MHRAFRPVIAGALSLALSAGAFLWLLLWPYFYSGVEVIPLPAPPAIGGVPAPPSTVEIAKTASLLEVNDWTVIPVILLPLALSGLGLMSCLRLPGARRLLYFSAMALGAFCLLSAFSVGLFYAPAAVALGVAAVMARRVSAPRPNFRAI